MRMKIDEFDKHYLVCNFLQNECLNMLIGDMPNETKEKIINSFIRFLREKKTVSERTLEAMTGKFNRVLYKETMRSVESFLFFDNNDEESVKNYVKKITFVEYLKIVSDCLERMKNHYIGKNSRMLKKKYCNLRVMVFIRANRAVERMVRNIQYVKDADTVFNTSFSDTAIETPIYNLTRSMIYTVLYDRGIRSSESKSVDPKNPEFVKLDTARMYEYVGTAKLKDLPYNIESLLNAASTIFDLIINMGLRDYPLESPISNIGMVQNFYMMVGGIGPEIIKRAQCDVGITLTDEPATNTYYDKEEPDTSDDEE